MEKKNLKEHGFEMTAYGKNNKLETVMRILAAMSESDNMSNTSFGRQVNADQKKIDENCRKKYQEVFDQAPEMPVERIKYFCSVMLKMWAAMEERDLQAKRSAYDDVFSIFMQGIHKTFINWCRRDRKTVKIADEVETEYPFPRMLEIKKENMGMLLSETINKIIIIRPEESDTAKKEFLWELAKLFEICCGILHVFAEMNTKCKDGDQ